MRITQVDGFWNPSAKPTISLLRKINLKHLVERGMTVL